MVALVALLVRGATPSGVLNAWYDGVWGSQNIFTFAFQMVLILVTGYTLAEAPPLKRAIVFVASKPTNQIQGALLCFSLSAALSLLNWGLGLVAAPWSLARWRSDSRACISATSSQPHSWALSSGPGPGLRRC
ncbi:short chain fatty acid transporter family protein [Mycobacterium ulcerans str. Harvey]|uniref:Short chain fatty acid transporter family protein n=1 Tax=Mycobacterium ulcerans str. Harvey TaxID=1299332 RepID=A0ABP3AE23_MYCUL|nr:short chain fatty acid transporter family protein [Mycobacterium ulcerans str. Harvey]